MIYSPYHYVGPKAKARGSQPHFIEGSDLVLSRGHALEDHVRGGGFLMTVIISPLIQHNAVNTEGQSNRGI
ncbi:hypothetical protein N9M41_03390 [Rhodopirellula sp.]|jgi:hypothetical protein|nr:hypothetical protein [Rhodopirellula sp.]